MDEQLFGTWLTGNKLAHLLTNSPELKINGRELKSVEGKDVANGDFGPPSKFFLVSLNWSPSKTFDQDQLPKSVFVKVNQENLKVMFDGMKSKELDKINRQIQVLHDLECTFYGLKNIRDAGPLPRCYYMQMNSDTEPGLMILEDLSNRAGAITMKSASRGITAEQLDNILDALTSFQAWSVNNTKWRQTIQKFSDFTILHSFFEQMLSMYPQLTKQYPEIFHDFEDEKWRKVLNVENYVKMFGSDPRARYNLPIVLSQGDFHHGNWLFEKDPKTGKFGDGVAAIVDWQGAHQGCGILDLARIVTSSLSTKMRRDLGDNLLKRYVELFNSKVDQEENKITFENAKRAYDEMFAFSAMSWSNVYLMDNMIKFIKVENDDERQAVKARWIERYTNHFNEARKILGI